MHFGVCAVFVARDDLRAQSDLLFCSGWMDHGTLGLLWGMMLIVGITMRTGVFEWTGVQACKLSKGE